MGPQSPPFLFINGHPAVTPDANSIPARLRYPTNGFVLIKLHLRHFGSRIALLSM
jgi:hypothetical protein